MVYKDKYLEKLIDSNKLEWEKMMSHKFVKEIGSGKLKSTFFIKYLNIEHSFVVDAVDHLTMAMFLTKNIDSKKYLHKILDGLLNDQNSFFIKAKKNLNKKNHIPEKAKIFRKFMKSCSKKGYEEIIVSFLAAESIYNNWCFNELSKTKNNNKTFSEWMRIHTSKSFFNQVKFFSEEAQHINLNKDPSDKQKNIFRDTLKYEIIFHDSIYTK